MRCEQFARASCPIHSMLKLRSKNAQKAFNFADFATKNATRNALIISQCCKGGILFAK